jgi:N6-L-threonylcarbamoyladenine synthase
MVYVLNKEGKPLMPTARHGRVRHLLKRGEAKVARRTPFTIQLLYETKNAVQPVTLGIDAGSKTVGISAVTEKQELFAAELKPRNDVSSLLTDRSQKRRDRRVRTLRYRKPRFLNRVRSKHKGWLAPSVEVKIHNHMQGIKLAMSILPITKIVVETAEFDMQVLKAIIEGKPLPKGIEYQRGEQYGFYNVRQYILWRDGYKCQSCKGRSRSKKLLVMKIDGSGTSRAPNNLVAVCSECAKEIGKGKKPMPKTRIAAFRGFKDAAFMGIMRKTLMRRVKAACPGIEVEETTGAVTKGVREDHGIMKSHINDALCIAGSPKAERIAETFLCVPKRAHNRSLHKDTVHKEGYREKNQTPKYMFGYQLFEAVKMPGGREGFVFGRRSTGSFDVRRLDGEVLSGGITYKKLIRIGKRKSLLIERRVAAPPTAFQEGVSAAQTNR